MIHDLYPVPIEERVMQALDTVRPYMESHGGNVELLGIEDGVAKLRLEGSCKSCRASSSTLELAVRQALQEAAPDLLGMDVEGIVEEEDAEVTGVPLPIVQMNGTPSWHTLDIDAPELLAATAVDGMSLVVANVDGTLLAYRNECASCGSSLEGGQLDGWCSGVSGLWPELLPAAGGPLDGRRAPPAPARSAAAGGRGHQGGAVKPLDEAVAARRKALMVSGLRGLAQPKPPEPAVVADPQERCDLCSTTVPPDHRHMLNLYERQIVCVCEACWALRSGEPEFRPTGNRTLWLEDFELPEELWAQFRIPIGLAFFMHSSVTNCVVALYPSPAGATESELHFETWNRLVTMNPVLTRLEPDAEALIVNRTADPPLFAIAPIDRCYMLVGLIKASWEGISGGQGMENAIAAYFDDLRKVAV